jgi:hypothetical protein
MRVLLLGNSNDTVDWFSGRKRQEIVRDDLAAEFGEPVSVVTKAIWPNEGMPAALERWMAAEQPDIVYINVVSFWFAYESVPLKAQRLLGRFGPRAGKAGFRLADSKRFAHNVVFRGIRRFAQATIGGDTHFTPEEVIARVSACLRVALRSEGVVVVVKGPYGRNDHGATAKQRRRNEQRRQQVNAALADLCATLHVRFSSAETPRFAAPGSKGLRIGDGLHATERGHAEMATDISPLLAESWRLAHDAAALESPGH